jgi:uncharacterized protein (TIGR02217 family)
MTFIDQRLLDCVSPGFSGGPMWNTRITPLASGNETRNAEWSMPHHKYTADYVVLEPRDQNEVLHAFWVARGSTHSFRFKDWNDFKIIDETMAVGDGTGAARQAVKTYTFGPSTYTRTVTLLSSVTVTANGSPLAVTFDDETGLITPVSVWPNGQTIVLEAEFDVKVRFGADYYPFTQPHRSAALCTVDLVESLR